MIGRVPTARVARTGHPFFVTTIALVAVFALTLASVATASATTANGYRLAGIVAVGPDYLGFLELPGGRQVLVRQGSVIEGGGRVLLLEAGRLRIGLPSGVVELTLEDSGRPATVQDPVAAADDVEAAPDPERETVIRRVDSKRVGEELRAAVKSGRAGSTQSIETAMRLAPILDLPPTSRLVAVNDRPVTSAEAAIASLERSLDKNIAATLTLADTNGGPGTRVYLLPQPPE